MLKLDPFKLTQKIPNDHFRRRALDVLLNVTIPFNRFLGLRIDALEADRVVIASPARKLRENHVGGAHACLLALIGEYAAGLCIAHYYGINEYRLIIGHLSVDYHKQGRGLLKGEASAPPEWPTLENGEAWIEMSTRITNAKDELVAVATTKWQLKEWDRVRK